MDEKIEFISDKLLNIKSSTDNIKRKAIETFDHIYNVMELNQESLVKSIDLSKNELESLNLNSDEIKKSLVNISNNESLGMTHKIGELFWKKHCVKNKDISVSQLSKWFREDDIIKDHDQNIIYN